MDDMPQYWTIGTAPPETPALRGLRWRYGHYCRRMWAVVDQAIAQAMADLPPALNDCLHRTLTYTERRALRSHVLWRLIAQTGLTVDLTLDTEDVLDPQTLTLASIRLEAIEAVLRAQSKA